MRILTIKVVPNPYSALDADGRAQCAVSKENAIDAYVGAELDHEESAKTGKNIFKFSADPVVLPRSAYYLRRLQERALLPADAETAKYAGIAEKDHQAPETALALEKERASNAFEEAHGHLPAFALQPSKTA
jgi:hypothetical protein